MTAAKAVAAATDRKYYGVAEGIVLMSFSLLAESGPQPLARPVGAILPHQRRDLLPDNRLAPGGLLLAPFEVIAFGLHYAVTRD